jgi:hypothetical protein
LPFALSGYIHHEIVQMASKKQGIRVSARSPIDCVSAAGLSGCNKFYKWENVDRLTHRALMVNMSGKSFRVKETKLMLEK